MAVESRTHSPKQLPFLSCLTQHDGDSPLVGAAEHSVLSLSNSKLRAMVSPHERQTADTSYILTVLYCRSSLPERSC